LGDSLVFLGDLTAFFLGDSLVFLGDLGALAFFGETASFFLGSAFLVVDVVVGLAAALLEVVDFLEEDFFFSDEVEAVVEVV